MKSMHRVWYDMIYIFYENKGTMGGLFRNKKLAQLGNALVEIPEAVVGEDAKIHPMRRVTRDVVYDLNKNKLLKTFFFLCEIHLNL